MDLNKLRIFKCVADFGGVSAASSALKMRQSSISTALSSLETELGYKLLQRQYRGMSMTKKGEKVYQYAKKTLEYHEEFLKTISDENSDYKIAGTLTVATSFGISASDWFIKKITISMEKYPDLKIRVINYTEGDFQQIPADVFICPKIYNSPELFQEKIEAFSFRLFASQDYIKKFGLPEKVEDLDNHRLISFTKMLKNAFNDVDSLLHAGRDERDDRHICLEINNSIGLLKIVKFGYGIAAIPVEEGLEEGLIPLLSSKDRVDKTTCFITYKNRKNEKNILALRNIFFNS